MAYGIIKTFKIPGKESLKVRLTTRSERTLYVKSRNKVTILKRKKTVGNVVTVPMTAVCTIYTSVVIDSKKRLTQKDTDRKLFFPIAANLITSSSEYMLKTIMSIALSWEFS